jgi:hypothetical protein
MADYHPLIAKAVAALEKNTGEGRRALYDRARNALVTQLRGVTPALSESDITRERLALEEAIRRVEAEEARRTRYEPLNLRPEPPPAARRAEPPAPEPAQAAPPPEPPPPPEAAVPPPPDIAPAETKPPAAPAEQGAPAGEAEAQAKPELSEAAPGERPVRRVSDEKPSISDQGLKGFRDVVAEVESLGGATLQGAKTARETFAAVPTKPSEFERTEPHIEPEGLRPGKRPPPPPPAAREPGRDSTPYRVAPPSSRAASRGPAVDLDRRQKRETKAEPEPRPPLSLEEATNDLAVRPPPPPERPAEDRRRARGGAEEEAVGVKPPRAYRGVVTIALVVLLVLGLGAVAYWQGPALLGMFQETQNAKAPSAPAPRDSSRAKISDRIGTQDARQTAPVSPDVAPVAQRVVLYEEDATDPAGKRYVGSAVWRTEVVAGSAGQPPDVAVRAEVEIPERQITVKLSLRRNTDRTLPASHTIEVMIALPADFSHGGISNIPGILMKQAEQTRGVPLAGLAVKVTTGFFLIGLSAVEADMQRNIQLLKERSWFDIPIVYNDGKRAILAVEKGTPGDRAFADAFTRWGG